MATDPLPDCVVLSTEGPGRALRRGVWLAAFALGSLMGAWSWIGWLTGAQGPAVLDHPYVLACLWVICALLVLLPPPYPHGTWTLSEQGIRFEPHGRGSPREVRWNEVTHVFLTSFQIVVRSARQSITLWLGQFDQDSQRAAVQYLRRKLEPDFDLTPEPSRSYEPTRRGFVRFVLKTVALATVAAVGAVVVLEICFIVLAPVARNPAWDWPAAILIFAAVFSVPILLVAPRVLRWRRKYPRWRERRAAPG